jgi:hypothetical protein
MTKFVFLSAGLATVLVVSLPSAPAQALNNKSWVSSTGSGSTCTRALPCGNFQTAHDQTNAGGEIGVVDSGDYGALVISKAISIIAEGVDATIISAGAGSAAIAFSSSTPPTDVVTLQGLVIDGLGTGGIGISWAYGPALVVKNCVIRNFKNAGAGWGIAAQVAVSGQLSVSDTLIVNNGGNSSGAGIVIKLQSGGSANVSINRTELRNNVNGIFADGSSGGGAVNLNVRDSVVTGSSNSGIIVFAPSASMTALVDRTTVNYSINTGVAAAGATATVRIGNSTISNNVTGVVALSGATLRSYKNNQINANSTDGTPITAEGLN